MEVEEGEDGVGGQAVGFWWRNLVRTSYVVFEGGPEKWKLKTNTTEVWMRE